MNDTYDPWENTIHVGQMFNGFVWLNHAAPSRGTLLGVLAEEVRTFLEPLLEWVQDPNNDVPAGLLRVKDEPRELLLYIEGLTKKWHEDEDSLTQDEWDVLERARLEIIEAPFHKEKS